ncbi:MAG: DUF3179 domain-containing protein [Acidobacteria bacterium]|nr:DUF3179 domain-containing protein [Acidobacteriota bacterium]
MRFGSLPALTACLAVAAATLVAVTAAGQSEGDDDRLHVILPRDAIPAIFNPEFEPASKAPLRDNELVLGVVGEREQRAYSTWLLDRHEIVNDVFEGRPIAATW